MKKSLTIILIILTAIIYLIGNYFVNFALKRATDNSPPPATTNITDPNLKPPVRPNFNSEIWTIQSADNLKLSATYFMPKIPTHRWAILVHGYGRDQTYTFDYAEEYLNHGYNVLTPDMRAAGLSEGTYLTMGTLESQDLILWTDKIVEYDPQAKIVFHGVSMGAATVLMASSLNPKNLVATVEDCGYTSAYEMFTAQMQKIFNLPEFPIMLIANIVSKIKTDAYISDAAPINSVANIKVPVLFIHGNTDELVPYEMMNRLYNATNAPVKETFTVDDAGHADAKIKDPSAYFKRVFEFINKYAN